MWFRRRFRDGVIGVAVIVMAASLPLSAGAGSGDNYPWKHDAVFPACAVDDWRFCKRYCTSWAAFALHDRNKYEMEHTGHARDWKTRAKSLGYAVDTHPVPGSIAWWDDGEYGHVAWVKAVHGNVVTIEEYNYSGGTYHERTIQKNDADGYIHYKDLVTNDVLRVIKKNQRDRTNAVYWAKAGGVFESWWRPGGRVQHSQLVHISQGDIRDIDARIGADDLHEVYTATTHNVYESWWYPHQGVHTSQPPIIHSKEPIRKVRKTVAADGTHQLYVMTDAGVDEYWWRHGSVVHKSRVMTLADPIAMKKHIESDGTQVLYVADQGYVYERRWRAGAGIAQRQISHIAQNDIIDIDLSMDVSGKHRLYVGTRDGGVWEASWSLGQPQAIGHWHIAGGSGVRAIQKYMEGTKHALYVATAGGVYEYTWPPDTKAVHGGAIVQGLADVRAFDRGTSVDGAQAVYTGFNTHIAETFWRSSGGALTTTVIE